MVASVGHARRVDVPVLVLARCRRGRCSAPGGSTSPRSRSSESGTARRAASFSTPRPSFDALGADRVLRRVVEHLRRQRDRAVRRIDVDAHRRVALEQLLGAFGQLVGVRGHVLAGDVEPRLLARERDGPDAAALLEPRRDLFQAAGVLGNRAVLVAGLLGADRGQRRAELLGLVGGDGGEGRARWRARRATPRSKSCETWIVSSFSECGLERERDQVAIG